MTDLLPLMERCIKQPIRIIHFFLRVRHRSCFPGLYTTPPIENYRLLLAAGTRQIPHKLGTQTLASSPHLDTSKSRADLTAMGKGDPTESRNRPNSDTYQAKDGTIFIPTETVGSGNMNAIFGDYAHELGNLLDVQING